MSANRAKRSVRDSVPLLLMVSSIGLLLILQFFWLSGAWNEARENFRKETNRDILMRLWGDDSFFNSRNLDVYITKLREFLREDPSIEIITIKGVGYHFAVG